MTMVLSYMMLLNVMLEPSIETIKKTTKCDNGRRKWANVPFKKTIEHFAKFPKLMREMPIF